METPPVAGDALSEVAPQQIAARLHEAVQLADDDLASNEQRVRELLDETSDHLDAWTLEKSVTGQAGDEPHRSRLECSLLERSAGQPVDEFLLIPLGSVQVDRPLSGGNFVFTRRHAESALRWFEQIGRKLAIDYEHQSFERYNARPDGLRPAAGWIGRLEIRDDGLYACDVAWTERARQLLAAGEYRYFSPVIYWTDEDYSDVAALGPVALTNDPAMQGVRPLAATRQGQEEPDFAADADDVVEDESPTDVQTVLRTEIEALNEQIDVLRQQLSEQAADAFVEQGMQAGKIVASTRTDWREDYLADAGRTVERLRRAPVLLPAGRVITPEHQRNTVAGTSIEQAGIEPEDLRAYEQAVAAGRVRRGGLPSA